MIEIRANAIRVRGAVVVRIAVVVDISKVRSRHHAAQPPVRAFQRLPWLIPVLQKFVVSTSHAFIESYLLVYKSCEMLVFIQIYR